MRWHNGLLGMAALAGVCLVAFGCADRSAACKTTNADKPWLDTAMSPECRADALVAKLSTVEQKLAALSGGGLHEYGIIEPQGSDGPAGPSQTAGAISLPNGLALAATFDPELAQAYGEIVGREFRAAGKQGMLGPTIDVARTWRSGRVPEGFGEDPHLSARIAAPFVKAVQAEGVAVTLKHFAVYTQEQGRTGDLPFGLKPAVDNVVSERVIREIYLPPFEAAVRDGGALNAMCAFPRVNGVYACENPFLLGILKKEWGMRGTVSPDFPDAQRTVVEAVNAGLDRGNFGLPGGMGPPPPPGPNGPPGAAPPGGAPPGAGPPGGGPPGGGLGAALGLNRIPGGVDLKTAVLDGRVSPARLDDIIRRRLISMFAVGAGLEAPAKRGELADGKAQALALRAAENATVLLRNESGILPLGASVKSITVIGAQAGPSAQVTTVGSAYVQPSRLVTALDAIRARAGGATVTYAAGSLGLDALPLVPKAVLRTPTGKPGLKAEYFANPSLRFEGAPVAERTEDSVNLSGPAPIKGLPGENGWSVAWTGTLTPRKSGLHNFTIAGSGSGRLMIDGKLMARFDRVDFGAISHAKAQLAAGKRVNIRLEFTPREAAPLPGMPLLGTTMGTLMRFGWHEPDNRIADAVAAAKKADVAIVFAADRHGEGADRTSFALPTDQDELITAVAAANPRTVVVLSTAGPVAMPWASKVQGIVQTWYSGDMFGKAVSRILFGDTDPQGRLPITFPLDETQGPAVETRNYPGEVDASGAIDKAHFDEGLLVGYRWYDARGQAPLYPFGFGLSYARVEISDLSVKTAGKDIRVSATVRNTGDRAGSEVVQIYAGLPEASGEPPKRLVGFQRVALDKGASRTIEIVVPAKELLVWDDAAKKSTSPAGEYQIMVGRSSRDIIFTQALKR